MRGTFDIQGYLASRTIPYSLEGKNVSSGWLGTRCVFCGDKSNHLGINLKHLTFNCFRCGETGTLFKLVTAIEPDREAGARRVLSEFRTSLSLYDPLYKAEPSAPFRPPDTQPLSGAAKKYLREKRKFPYKWLEAKYKIAGFNLVSSYKWRLFIPIYFNERLVTFTTRSYVDNIEPKYLHYPKRLSQLFVKETLYNLDNAKDGTALVVEGPTDVWRMGDGAVATFGVIFTQKQVKLLRERFKRVFIMYDMEPDAQTQAAKLADCLSTFNMEVNIVKIEKGDPGSLEPYDVTKIRKEIFGR